jgi:DNA-binding response OmpR family regulator
MALKTIVIEDERPVADSLERMLKGLGHTVCGVARRTADLAPLLARYEPDLVTIDVDLGERRDGIGVATALEAGGALPIVFIVGVVDEAEHDELCAIEGAVILIKPFTGEQLAASIAEALDRMRRDLNPELGP